MPSLADIKRAGTTVRIACELQELKFRDAPYAEFVALISKAISYSVSSIVSQKNVLQNLNEDQLTAFVISPLKAMMFDIAHERNIGGKCDISIVGYSEYLWLAEAKIFSSYGKLLGGYRQLLRRYATGLPNQDRGAMLIYMYRSGKAKDRMAKWAKYLLQSEQDVTVAWESSRIEFTSSQDHSGSGLPFIANHIPVILYHVPTDTIKPPKRIG